MLGLFDRPADEKALGALLKSPAIPGLTESLTNLSPTEWRTILARLRRARLLAEEDLQNRGHFDAHPLSVNTLANSSGVNEAGRGRNAISGSFTIIERLHRSCRILNCSNVSPSGFPVASGVRLAETATPKLTPPAK
jgi:hypothetical protein